MNEIAYAEGVRLGKGTGFIYLCWGAMMNGCMALIMWYGNILVKDGEMGIGDISAFLLYMILLMFSFMIIGFSLTNVYKTIGASEKLVSIMKKVPLVNSHGGKHVEHEGCAGEIEFRNVTFAYPVNRSQDSGKGKKAEGSKEATPKKASEEVEEKIKQDKAAEGNPPVLTDVSFTVASNKVIAFVGHSGCGKSSIINLVERFYDPQSGQVLFCGKDVKDLEP